MAGILGFGMKFKPVYLIYLVLTACALTLYVFRQLDIRIPFLSNYGNDLLFIPLLLFYAERLMFIFQKQFIITPAHIIITTVYTSVVFEYFFPMISNEYTSDALDILCYISGGMFFYSIQKMRIINKSITI